VIAPAPARPTEGEGTLLGLRVDVDTHEGMRDGVPRLLDVFRDAGVRATFYFAMGPDHSGRAVFNLLRPGFLRKMRRTGARRTYGWRTVLSGTLLPSRPIGAAFPDLVRRAAEEGHETGLHAWDHRTWQDRVLGFRPERVRGELDRGREAFAAAAREAPLTLAAPAWLTRDEAVLHQESYQLQFASDCRGSAPFLPVVGGVTLRTPQVPTTLPTLDEALGDLNPDAASFFAEMLRRTAGEAWPVLTVHAELEGGPYATEFAAFLRHARAQGLACCPLGALLARRLAVGPLPEARLGYGSVRGRHGVVSVQEER
jgi:undecaprenyl phosphate-alpha-L-ara4FN deformylase